MKKILPLSFMGILMLVLGTQTAKADVQTLYYEDFGNPSSNTAVNKFSAFSNENTKTYIEQSGDWKVGTGNGSEAKYTGASQNGNLYVGASGKTITFTFGTAFQNATDVKLSFGYYKGSGNNKANNLKCYISGDGGQNWSTDIIPSNSGSAGWNSTVVEISLDGYLNNLVVKFSNEANNTARVDDLKITGNLSSPSGPIKTDPSISFSEEEVTVTLGEEYTLPTLTVDPSDLAISYSSTNQSVATVDEDGVVEIKASGETTIKAIFAGNDDYYAKTAEYTLTVEPVVLDGVFEIAYPKLYGAKAEFTTDGNHYEANSDTWKAGNVTMEVSGKYRLWENGKDLRIYKADESDHPVAGTITISVPQNYAITSIEFNLSKGELVPSSGKVENKVWTWNGAEDEEQNVVNNTVSFTGDKPQIVGITVNYTPMVAIADHGYSTLYYEKMNLTVPEGLSAWTFSVNSSNEIVAEETYRSEDVIPAGEAVVLFSNTADNYIFNVANSAPAKSTTNKLKGTDDEEDIVAESNEVLYFLGNGANGIGFYKAYAGETGSFKNGAHKAYLSVSKSNGGPAVACFILALGNTTGVELIPVYEEELEGDNVTYNVLGQKVADDYKGIVIRNGKKFINK